jgi:hypothetical protein
MVVFVKLRTLISVSELDLSPTSATYELQFLSNNLLSVNFSSITYE